MGTNGPNIPRLHADDIPWAPKATPRPEAISGVYLAQLTHNELFDYVIDLREDAGGLRRTLHAAIACIARLTEQLTRSRRTIVDLQAALREQRRAA